MSGLVNVRTQGIVTSNIVSFSVQEDATPIDPSSSAGGVGQISVSLDDFPDAMNLVGEMILADGSRGRTSGNIRSVSAVDGKLSLTADSVLGKFNTERTALPFTGTFGGAVQYYCDLVDIGTSAVVDPTVAARPVTYPGWRGNVWVMVKQMLAKEQVEMSLVFDRVVVRPLRQVKINQDRMISTGRSVDNNTMARTIEIYYYNYFSGSQVEVFPLSTEEPSIYSVGADETIKITQQLNASLTSVNQPAVIDFVNDTSYAGTNGVYAVAGNDGLPITAAQWTAHGGSLTVAIDPNDRSLIEITIKGASMRDYAPYRIAMTSGSSNYYNSLHITATGVTWNKELLTLRTGVPDDQTSVLVGTTVDNIFISTLEQALNTGCKTAQAYAGLNYTVNGNAFDLNRGNGGTHVILATIEDFNTAYAGYTMTQFNTEWTGQLIFDFNAYWLDQSDLLWENQLFGNAPGARVLTEDVNFRVTTATTTESSVQFSASLDTTVEDFNNRWTGGTLDEFNSQFLGNTIKQFNVIPIRRNS